MKIFKLDNSQWVEGAPAIGEKVRYISPNGGINETYYNEESKEDIEIKWQDGELKKYDNKLQPDRPNAARILEYRQELRDYILHVDFPNGTRPEL